ncbi:vomeronasal 1 receptor ornAnaV1R3046 [Ornithorhynchus anatinus]|uniref:Vomeronasal type-1 receptor n=1 Tax=Ornithorhynchus anatinus TaxID=9258 RepID=A0A6I8N4Z3_ORNAN|nr:vomeronasal 1 receptor ornAnaV1R3046 [Ornithorhynchus anatinus]
MVTGELCFVTVILLQVSLGVSMNVFLLLFYAHLTSPGHRLGSSDLIFAHLALANTLILLTYGVPEIMLAWGLRGFLDAVGCKILMYLYRVARGLAICTTCLLSVFQAVTVSPGTSRWARVKARLPECIVPCCLLSWVINMLVDFDTLLDMTSPQNGSSVYIVLDLKYCSKISLGAESTLAIAVVLPLRDLFFVGLMSLASGYMVLVLHRHHRRVRLLHGPGRAAGEMPEVRAAKRVVALVTLYVLLYGRQSVTLSALINMKVKSPLLMNCHTLLGFTFSAVSPLLVIRSDRRMGLFWRKQICFQPRSLLELQGR